MFEQMILLGLLRASRGHFPMLISIEQRSEYHRREAKAHTVRQVTLVR